MNLFSIMAIIAVMGFSIGIWRRSGMRWRVAVVESLRVLLVCIAVLLLRQPESIRWIPSDRRSEVVLLLDRSTSMQTRDVKVDTGVISRQEMVDRIQSDSAWAGLDQRFVRVDREFAVHNPSESDLAAAIEQAFRDHESASAIVLVSDGDFNQGVSPIPAAARIAAQTSAATRVAAISVGAEDRLPDIELVSVDVPTFGVVGKPIRIPYVVRNWFPDLQEETIGLQIDNVSIDQQSETMPSGGRWENAFQWQSDVSGTFELTVQLPVKPGEINPSNNSITKTIEIRQEKLRVLLIDSVPRWEYRYLRNALLRDPGIDVSCLLFQPGIVGVGGGGEDYLTELPEQAAQWASYDVIVVGDVGVTAEQLTVEQCRQIRGLVEQQAVGLVLMPGPRGEQSSLQQTALADLFPVVIDGDRPRGVGNEMAASLSLTNAGRRSLLTELEDDVQVNWSTWESLPGFYWHAGVLRAKAGSEVLAVHSTASNQYGRLPMLVTRSSGAGKVLFMGSDAVWRWRMGVEDKYHYRFWGQAIRWMAYQRNMAVGQRMRLSYRPEQPRVGESVSFRAMIMDQDGDPCRSDAANLNVVSSDGTVQQVRLNKEDAEWGLFTSPFRFDQPGTYELKLEHPAEESVVQAKLTVQGRAAEQIGRPARSDTMRELGKVGRGDAFRFDQIASLVESLNQLPDDPATLRRIQWWNHPAVLLAMIAGMVVFWVGRKWAGQI